MGLRFCCINKILAPKKKLLYHKPTCHQLLDQPPWSATNTHITKSKSISTILLRPNSNPKNMKFIYHQVTITITNPISWVKGKLHELHFRWTYQQPVNCGIFRSERHHGVSNIQVQVGHCFGWLVHQSPVVLFFFIRVHKMVLPWFNSVWYASHEGWWI